MTTKPQPQYTPEQRAEAVRISEQSGKSTYQVARDLGISQTTLSRWRRQALAERKHDNDPDVPLSTDERRELARLRRENKQLQLERDLLKKAAAFFAKDHS